MQKIPKTIQKRRRYTIDFKKRLVHEFESGLYSVQQLSIQYTIAPKVIYRWIYKFSTFNDKGIRIIEMTKSSTDKIKQLEQKVKQLEQIVGQKQIKIDFLEKMIQLADQYYDIDIKKNSNTPPSNGSGSTESK